jgi:hypothetical protein
MESAAESSNAAEANTAAAEAAESTMEAAGAESTAARTSKRISGRDREHCRHGGGESDNRLASHDTSPVCVTSPPFKLPGYVCMCMLNPL